MVTTICHWQEPRINAVLGHGEDTGSPWGESLRQRSRSMTRRMGPVSLVWPHCDGLI